MKKFACITGASSGLGAFLANRFWQAGYSLILIARREEHLKALQQTLSVSETQTVIIHPCDLANEEALSQLINILKKNLPYLNVLINNAAIHGPIGPLQENNVTTWQEAIAVDLLAPVRLCQALIPLMRELPFASIINLSGGGATAPRPHFSAYATAKTALVRFSETLAEELKSSNIHVNCIAPGAMQTALLEEVLQKDISFVGEKEMHAAQKVFTEGGADMQKVADLALFLASIASHGITGKLISAMWDNWEAWPQHLQELNNSDAYTLRRITGRDRGFDWGDK